MNYFRTMFFIYLFGSLSGCSAVSNSITAVGNKWFADDYVFTSADGTTNRYWLLAKDGHKQPEAANIYLRKFNVMASTSHDTATHRTHMELTVSDLKQIAVQNQTTILIRWYPHCGPSIQSEFDPTMRMLHQLRREGVEFNKGNVGLAFASVSYDPVLIDHYFKLWKIPFQSYIIPSPIYPEKVILKKIFFNRELCPECYGTEKDDIEKYFLFAIDKNGKVIDKVAANYDDAGFAKDLERFAKNIKASIL